MTASVFDFVSINRIMNRKTQLDAVKVEVPPDLGNIPQQNAQEALRDAYMKQMMLERRAMEVCWPCKMNGIL